MSQLEPDARHVTHLTKCGVIAMFTSPKYVEHALEELLNVLSLRAVRDVPFASKLNVYLKWIKD